MASFSHSLGHVCSAAAAARQGQTLWVAVATPDHAVHVYSRTGEEGFARQAELECHEAPISGLAFTASAAVCNGGGPPLLRLVSSSHDRNSYVWTQQRGPATSEHPAACSWQPELVITKLRGAGLCATWSPCGRKYAIGGSERVVDVLYWAEEKELWAPKLIRKQLECAAMAVAWHPSGALVATAGTDGKLRLFNAVVAGVDGPSSTWPVLGASRFGDCLLELPLPGGWGLAVAFSPDGATLAATSQGSQLTLLPGLDLRDPVSLEPAAAAGRAQHLQLPALPLKCLAFLENAVLAGAGFDYHPLLFRRQADGQWQHAASLRGMRASSSSKAGAAASSLMARVKLFEQHAATASAMGAARAASADKENSERGGVPGSSEEEQGGGGPHQNTIISIVPLAAGPSGRLSMLTASLEGCVAEWHVSPSLL